MFCLRFQTNIKGYNCHSISGSLPPNPMLILYRSAIVARGTSVSWFASLPVATLVVISNTSKMYYVKIYTYVTFIRYVTLVTDISTYSGNMRQTRHEIVMNNLLQKKFLLLQIPLICVFQSYFSELHRCPCTKLLNQVRETMFQPS